MDNPQKRTYGQILKSSALIGGSSMVNVVLGIIRTKAMALLLGPTGIGLIGVYGSIADLTRSIAGLGINTSGVRQIAEAAGSGDGKRLSRTVTTLRRVAFCSGALGALLLLAFSAPVSRLTFDDSHHVGAVALLALAVFFGDVSAGQGALVQGMRRIADLARMNVLGALYGTVFSVLIVYFYSRRGVGEQGVVPALVCVAGMGILTSWWYARKVKVEPASLSARQIRDEASALLKLGVVFMITGLLPLAAAYLVRLIVTRKIDIQAAGFYQAAWQLGGFYIAFILQAMGADFYPRLTAVSGDHSECNRMVNEQAEVGLLLAGPGVLGTLVFAPLVILLFYSGKFEPSAEILRWICLGMMLRVIIWPVGFILLAKGERGLLFFTEIFSNVLFVAMVWFGVVAWGLKGTGIAFFGMYVVYSVLLYAIVRRLTGFRWSAANRRLGALFVPLTAAVFLSWYLPVPRAAVAAIGGIVTVLTGIYSLKILCTLIPLQRLPQLVQKALRLFRVTAAIPAA